MNPYELYLKNVFFIFVIVASEIVHTKTIEAKIIPPPVIDGEIEKSEWQEASWDSGFTMLEPNKGMPATEKTNIRLGMDNENLYVAFQCNTKNINAISAGNPIRDRGDMHTDDSVVLLLDTFHDKRSAYLFHVNVLNTQTDMRIESDGGSIDKNWDTEWISATVMNEKGWSAEFAIPLKNIKFSSTSNTWGINFGRIIPRNREIVWWSGTLEDVNRISQAGTLVFSQHKPEIRKPLTLLPYINSYMENFQKPESNSGFDLEIPVTTDISANITVNPDFASLEGDKEEINLDPWDIMYSEKRPFFRDISALFDVRYKVFYSRRIGDILHGEKIFGKVGTMQVAGIFARTRNILDSPNSESDESFPRANYSVLRIQKDIFSSSTCGIMFAEKKWRGGYNQVLSLDTKMRLPHHVYATGQFILTTPRSLNRTNLNNVGGFFRVARETNIYHYHLRLTSLGENLKNTMNALGYLRYDNIIELDGEFWYKYWVKNNTLLKYVYYGGNYKYDWSQDSNLERYQIRQNFEAFFTNRFNIECQLQYEYRDNEWRKEGQLHEYKKTMELEFGFNTLEWNYATAGLLFGQTFDGPFYSPEASIRIKPFENVSITYEYEALIYNKRKVDPAATNVDIHVLTTDVHFTPDLFFRILTQYRSDNNHLYFFGNFGYRYQPPNSAIYLTYSYDKQELMADNQHSNNKILYIKISHAFSL